MLNIETNTIENKEQLNDDFEQEVIAFLNYKEGRNYIYWYKKGWTSCWSKRC